MEDNIVKQVAIAMNNAGIEKAQELGAENVVASVIEATLSLVEAAKTFAVIVAVLGADGARALFDGLAMREAEKAIREAEDVLKEGLDGQG